MRMPPPAANNQQRAFMSVLAYDFMEQALGGTLGTSTGAYEYDAAETMY